MSVNPFIKELVLGQIKDDFDPQINIPISPGCFLGKEHIFPDFENLDYVDTIQSNDELIRFDRLTSEEALFFVNVVAKKYNPENFDKYSFLFWKAIYFPWLGMVIPWLYRKQLLARKAIERYKDEGLKVTLVRSKSSFEFQDNIDFMENGIRNVNLNSWILSDFFKKNIPARWSVDYEEDFKVVVSNKKSGNSKSVRSKIRKELEHFFKSFFNRSSKVYGFSIFTQIFFHFLFAVKPPIRGKNRTKMAQVAPTNSVIEWDIDIYELMDTLIPESIKYLHIGERRFVKKGKIYNFSNTLYHNVLSTIKAANAYEGSAVVMASQHGGHNYGSAITFEYGKQVEFSADFFITWGWSNINGESINTLLPLPSPLLSKYFNKHHEGNSSVLLVGTDMSVFLTYFEPRPVDKKLLEYRKNKALFINKILDDYSLKNFYYRPYRKREGSLLDQEYYEKNNDKIKILDTGDFHEEMRKCKLLILDHPGTTWNIAMAMNTPTICFWKRDHFPFNKEAEIQLGELEKLGLYFEDPLKAAQKAFTVLSENENISEWWNQIEIQNVRKKWMDSYARTEIHWFQNWVKSLWWLK